MRFRLVLAFAVGEIYALRIDKVILSRFIWSASKAWPPLPSILGLIASGAAVRLFWQHRGRGPRTLRVRGRDASFDGRASPLTSGVTRNDQCPRREDRGRHEAIGQDRATMEPIVAGYVATRWKIAGAFALGATIITTLGWVVSLFAGKIVAWLMSLIVAK